MSNFRHLEEIWSQRDAIQAYIYIINNKFIFPFQRNI